MGIKWHEESGNKLVNRRDSLQYAHLHILLEEYEAVFQFGGVVQKAIAYAKLGNNTLLSPLIDEMNSWDSWGNYYLAEVYTVLGEKETAMSYLNRYKESGQQLISPDRFEDDIFLRPLFDYPPYQAFRQPQR